MTTLKKQSYTDKSPSTKEISPFGVLSNSVFMAAGLGHFSVDLLNGTRATLLTFLSPTLGLNNAALGTISTIYVWASAAAQPIFGWLADRIGTRWLAALGIFWMFAFFELSMLTVGPLGIIFLVFASFGSAAFHPVGTMEATLVGREQYAGRETTAASWFFFFGQFGLFLGPTISGVLLSRFGLTGLMGLAILLVPISLNAGWQLRYRHLAHAAHRKSEAALTRPAADRKLIITLALMGGLQAWAQQNMITFVPKYLADLGQTPATYGLVSGLFMGGSAFGNVIGGNLADRFGKQRIVMTMLLLSTIPLFIISQIGWSHWLFILVPLAGFFTGSVHSIVVVAAQRALPMGMATASGLTLGFIFSAGALGTLLSGPLADSFGWPPVFQLTAGLTLFAALLTNGMKNKV